MGSIGLRQGAQGRSGAARVSASLLGALLLVGCFGAPRAGRPTETTCEGDACAPGTNVANGDESTFVGDVTVVRASDFEALRGIRIVRGALVIRPGEGAEGSTDVDLQHLDSLATLEEVGSLEIRDDAALLSVRGLAKLRVVHGNLTIAQDSALVDVNGLAALETVEGTLRIGEPDLRPDAMKAPPVADTRALTKVWLPRLSTVGGLVIEGNDHLETIELPALESIAASGLTIRYDPAIKTLQASFPALVRARGRIAITGEQKIVRERQPSPNGGTQLVEVARIPPFGNDSLQQIEWPALEDVEDLNVETLPKLEKVRAAKLKVASLLTLQALPKLKEASFESLARLGNGGDGGFGLTSTPLVSLYVPSLSKILGNLVVSDVAALKDFTSFPSLVEVSVMLSAVGNPNLTSLHGLERLTGIEQVDLTYNDALESLDGLDGLTRVLGTLHLDGNGLKRVTLAQLKSAMYVRITGEAGLETISAPNLDTVEGTLQVESCDALKSLQLPKLRVAGDVSLAAGAARVADARFDLLKDVTGSLAVQDTLATLGPFAALERVGGNLTVRSSYVTAASAQAFVAQLKGRRNVGGTIDVVGTAQ